MTGQTKSEIYLRSYSNDLYFQMVKITNINKLTWENFALKSNSADRSAGVAGFLSSLEYYNHEATEVWVAYASTREIRDPNHIDENSIEMFVTVATSDNAPFISNMGINRSHIFYQAQHKNLSPKLHSFAAEVMLERYSDKKYMITNPLKVMREILIKAFEENGLMSAIHLGDNTTQYGRYLKEDLRLRGAEEDVISEEFFQELFLKLSVFRPNVGSEDEVWKDYRFYQQLQRNNDKIFSPISIEITGEKPYHYKTPNNTITLMTKTYIFTLKDLEGNILCKVDQSQNQEFKWFFDHPHQIKKIVNDDAPQDIMVTCELAALAKLNVSEQEVSKLEHIIELTGDI